MRYASSGGSKRGVRKGACPGKFFLILLAVLVGILVAAEARYNTLRIAGVEIEPLAVPLLGESVWREIPHKAERFWPLLWTSKRSYEAAIEKAHPVRAELLLKSWGKYKLRAEFLQPEFMLYWENKYWYASSDSRMWLTSLPDNEMADRSAIRRLPVLVWGSDGMSLFDISNADGNVHRSGLPVALIKGWYDSIEFLGWTDKTKSMYLGKREGRNIIRLVLDDGKGGRGAELLFPDSPEQWREAGMAVKTIYPDVTRISSDIFIDMTYKGKIIVSNRVK